MYAAKIKLRTPNGDAECELDIVDIEDDATYHELRRHYEGFARIFMNGRLRVVSIERRK